MCGRTFAVGEEAMLFHTAPSVKRVLLAQPRGYCAGVDRAVEAVERALKLPGLPVYVRDEIVHGRHTGAATYRCHLPFSHEVAQHTNEPARSTSPYATGVRRQAHRAFNAEREPTS